MPFCFVNRFLKKQNNTKMYLLSLQFENNFLKRRSQVIFVFFVAGEWRERGWSCPRSQVSPWDGLPSEGPWLPAGNNSRASHIK